MAKEYFQFKQFRVNQENCAMKVSTEACLFGACIQLCNAQKVLDIGTGTALLPLMLAQKYPNAHFTGVEIDPDAALQAQKNILQSDWATRIHIENIDIQNFKNQSSFDAIITNPPFYQNHLPTQKATRNIALHTETLPFSDLIKAINQFLNPKGDFWILLPPQSMDIFEPLAQTHNWYKHKSWEVYHSPKHPLLREIAQFKQNETHFVSEKIYIKKEEGSYSTSFSSLLKDYYLIF